MSEPLFDSVRSAPIQPDRTNDPLFDSPECPECHAPRIEVAPRSFLTDHRLDCPWLHRTLTRRGTRL